MRNRDRLGVLLLTVTAWMLLSGFSLPGAFDRLRAAGYRLLGRGDIAGAERAYQEAVKQRPDDPQANLDYGAALYRAQKYQEAAEAFARASKASDPTLQEVAEYNAGNALYRARQFEQAAEHYKRSLQLQPGDQEAKYNLEMAHRQQQQQQSQSQSGDKDDKKRQRPKQNEPQPEPKREQMSKQEADRILQASSSDDERLQKQLRRSVTTDQPTRGKDW